MDSPIHIVGPDRAVELFGVRMLGFDAGTLRKLLLTIGLFAAIWLIATILRFVIRRLLAGRDDIRARFISQQAVAIVSGFLFVTVFISIWFSNPARLASVAALLTAGLAIAMQKFVMSIVGYFAILRGNTFQVGDRITMGGVRGDVIALGYIRTIIMEMGQPPEVREQADPAMWVQARQYTGRIVSVTNDKIFDTPVYNFTRQFPFIFEEMHLPIRYAADRDVAERVLLDAARKHSVKHSDLSQQQLDELAQRYFVEPTNVDPRVYYRLTDNWLDLTVRYVVPDHGIREIKDAMSRDILKGLDEAKIEIASATFEVVGMPSLKIARETVHN